MQADHYAGKDSPEQPGQSANRKEDDAHNDVSGVVILSEPNMNFVFCQIGNVFCQSGSVVVHGLAGENPTHVGPPLAIDRRMRITFLIRKLVMDTMSRDPENRSAFKSESGAPGEKIFDPFRSLVSTVSQETVIAHANAEAAGNPPQEYGDKESFPGEEK